MRNLVYNFIIVFCVIYDNTLSTFAIQNNTVIEYQNDFYFDDKKELIINDSDNQIEVKISLLIDKENNEDDNNTTEFNVETNTVTDFEKQEFINSLKLKNLTDETTELCCKFNESFSFKQNECININQNLTEKDIENNTLLNIKYYDGNQIIDNLILKKDKEKDEFYLKRKISKNEINESLEICFIANKTENEGERLNYLVLGGKRL